MTNQDGARFATCEKLRQLRYGRFNRIRLYGEEVQLLSDPFPEANGIAVEVTTKDHQGSRTLKLPLPIVQMAMQTATV
jgi:hypothetical protein